MGYLQFRTGITACELFENSSGAAMLSPVGHPGQCIGYATSLGQYFIDFLYRDRMAMKWALIVASHIIKQAKRYSMYCDGDTHLLEIPDAGNPRLITDQNEIAQLESYLAKIDSAMLTVLPDGNSNDATLEARVDAIASAIDVASRLFTVAISGVGAMGIAGYAPSLSITQSPTASQELEDE